MGSPTIASLFPQRAVVGVGDMSVSNNPNITLSTYALGSCVAVIGYDAAMRAGGLLHLMLPDSKLSPDKAISQPAMFADTGLPLLLRALAGLKSNTARMRWFVAGGASVLCTNDNFRIGERNIRSITDQFTKYNLRWHQSALGGTINRTVHLNVGTGNITLKTPESNDTWSLAA